MDVGCADHDGFAAAVGGAKRDLLQELLHDRVQAFRADVLNAGIDLGGEIRERPPRWPLFAPPLLSLSLSLPGL